MSVEATSQLSSAQLEALATLEERVVSADGGRLKLEWGMLRNRAGTEQLDYLWYEQGRLIGFLGLYPFGGAPTEVSGMVDPSARERGIASSLLDAALPACRLHGARMTLLVVPRDSVGGHALALSRGGTPEHSEHALLLRSAPASTPGHPELVLRAAEPEDFDAVSLLMASGFGHQMTSVEELRDTGRSGTVIAELDGSVVGSVRLSHDGTRGGVYGFVISERLRGQGLGRTVLHRVCTRLLQEGMREVGLEVAIDNDRALGLYASLGFTRVSTEDHYALPL